MRGDIMLPIGFKQTETMKGYLRFLDDARQERSTRFDCDFALVDWGAFVDTGETELTGRFNCEGFVSDAPFSGKLFIDPFRKKRLTYDFTFEGPDDKHYRFYGEKRIEFLRFPQTISTLYSRLEEGGGVVATGVLWFDFRTLPAYVASLRPVLLK